MDDDDGDTEAPTTVVPAAARSSTDRVTERLGATVMSLVAENVSLSERVAEAEAAREDKMVRLGGKKFTQPENAQEIYERARRDVKDMKDAGRKMRKAAASKSAPRPSD